MNLVIDIGNTCAKMAVFANGELIGEVVRTDNKTLVDLPAFVNRHGNIQHAIVSTVVTLGEEAEERLAMLPFKVLMLNASTPLPIGAQYRFPESMGSDRIAADVGALMQVNDRPVMVFDAGTCLTSELLHPKEGIIGGTISPGMHLRLLSMHEHTSALPLIKETLSNHELLGTDTATAMLSGAINSVVFEIEGYVRRLLPAYPDLVVFLTGGDSFSFDISLKARIIQDKFLLLRGLNHILDFNEPT